MAFRNAVYMTLVLFSVAGCAMKSKGDAMSDAKELDELLGVRFLAGKDELKTYIHRPSQQLGYYEAYARFAGDEAAFRDLVAILSLGSRGSAAAGGHLPAAWKSSSGVSLPWWNPSPENPTAAAAGRHGVSGWIVAKHERGHVYLMVTDTDVVQR